ncbi:MAG: GNAT family N-acetyltransferase [Neisseria sp.]|nr:GNAT family N-acetyltransferase [Neisseria sp.]
MTQHLLFRIANRDDAEEIAELFRACGGGWPDGGAADAGLIGRMLADGRHYSFVYDHPDHAGRLLGCITVRLHTPQRQCADIAALAVRPERQGQGIGGALLRAAEDFAADHLKQGSLAVRIPAGETVLAAYCGRLGYEPCTGQPDKGFIALEKCLF